MSSLGLYLPMSKPEVGSLGGRGTNQLFGHCLKSSLVAVTPHASVLPFPQRTLSVLSWGLPDS